MERFILANICLTRYYKKQNCYIKDILLEILTRYYYLIKLKVSLGLGTYGYVYSRRGYVWGDNQLGQLGLTGEYYNKPHLLPLTGVKKIKFGKSFMLILTDQGLYYTGLNNDLAKLAEKKLQFSFISANVKMFDCYMDNFIIVDNDIITNRLKVNLPNVRKVYCTSRKFYALTDRLYELENLREVDKIDFDKDKVYTSLKNQYPFFEINSQEYVCKQKALAVNCSGDNFIYATGNKICTGRVYMSSVGKIQMLNYGEYKF